MSIEEIEKLADEAIEELEGSRRPAILSAMKKLDRIRHLAGRMVRMGGSSDVDGWQRAVTHIRAAVAAEPTLGWPGEIDDILDVAAKEGDPG